MDLSRLEDELTKTIQDFCEKNNCKFHNFYINLQDTLDGRGNLVGQNLELRCYLIDLQPKAEGRTLRVAD